MRKTNDNKQTENTKGCSGKSSQSKNVKNCGKGCGKNTKTDK